MSETARVAVAARVFTLAGLISVSVLTGPEVLRGALLLLVVAAWAQLFSLTGRLPDSWGAIAEGAVVGVLAAVTWPNSDAVTPYLVVPALVGGLSAGTYGVLRVLAVEATVTSIAWAAFVGSADRGILAGVIIWLFTGLGLGILGVSFRRAAARSGSIEPYRNALGLIKQLHALSGQLTAGLDAVSMAETIMSRAARQLPVLQSVILVRGPSGSLAPLRFSDGASPESLLAAHGWLDRAWDDDEPTCRGHRVAIPLRNDAHVVALLEMDCVSPPDWKALSRLIQMLAPAVLQLYAALLFGDIRDAATSDERQRLAREVHDGVAQDVASLGYLVDNIAESTMDDEQAKLLDKLRAEITRVVGELRHSVFDLRNEVGAGQGLGHSISSFARHIGSHSELTVHVTLDEATTRLRADVESELLRIAQEAINNARKHSGGRNLWVHCSVNPPQASLVVRDDGFGLGRGRDDSHGLRIMRERAERIGAELTIGPSLPDGLGTSISVRLPARMHSLSEA
jgi:signal transduction histidine kinase